MSDMLYSEPYKSCSMMGALRIAANFDKTVCIINGPAGCAFFCRNTILQINGYLHPLAKNIKVNIYTVDFNEKDVIFGAKDKLVKAILQIFDLMHPEMIFIFNCCVSEVIGEDLDEVVFEAEQKIDAMLIPVRTAGFKGDHKFGMRLMNEIIFDKLIRDNHIEKKSFSVNILGETDVYYSTTRELSTLLKEANIEIICRIPGRSNLEQIRKSVNARLNIVICGSASYVLAEKYRIKFDIPYIHGNRFYSISESYKAYCEIYNFFGISTKKITEMRDKALEELRTIKEKLQDKKVFIIAGARRAVGYAEVFRELGMEVSYIFSETSPGYTERGTFDGLAKEVVCDEWDADLREKIINQKPHLVISTIPEVTLPIRTVSRVVDDFSGFEGTIRMAKYVNEMLENRKGTLYWQTVEN